MARRRIDYKFLGIIAAVGVCAIAAGLVVFRNRIWKDKPDKFIALAKQTEAAGNLEDAARNWATAIHLSSKTPDPNLHLALGDVLYKLTVKEPEYVTQAQLSWNRALEIDPGNVEASRRLFEYWKDWVNLGGARNEVLARYEEAAKRLVAAEPTHRAARFALAEVPVRTWMSGSAVSESKIEGAIVELKKLMEEDPTDSAAMVQMVEVEVFRAGESLTQRGDRAEAGQHFREAERIAEDALKAQPDNAKMHFDVARVHAILYARDRGFSEVGATTRSGTTKPTTDITPLLKRRDERFRQLIEKANALVKPDDKSYVDIRLAQGRIYEVVPDPDRSKDGDRSRVEKLYRELYAEKPGDVSVLFALSNFLIRKSGSPQERVGFLEEAVRILSEPLPPSDRYIGVKAQLLTQFDVIAKLQSINARMELVGMSKDKAQREKLLTESQDSLDKVVSKYGAERAPGMLIARGRIEYARGKREAAIQSWNKAMTLFAPTDGSQERIELMLKLANANLEVRPPQTGEAKRLAGDVANQLSVPLPTMVQARLILGQAYYEEKQIFGRGDGDPESARYQADVLEKLVSPEFTPFVGLRLATLDPDRADDKPRIQKYYGGLAEKTREEKLIKGRIAGSLKMTDESIRLLRSVWEEKPDDVDLALGIASIYQEQKKDNKAAVAFIDEALAKNPGNERLERGKIIAGGDKDAIGKLGDDIIKKMEPFARQMNLYGREMRLNNAEKAMTHLVEAEKIRPEDPRMLEAMFGHYLGRKDFDKAAGYMERLVRADGDKLGGLTYRVSFAMERGDRDGAYEQALRLTKERPEFDRSWYILGAVQKLQGKYSEAITNYLQALARRNNNVDAIIGLVECYTAIGKPGVAGDPPNPNVPIQNQKQATDARKYIELGRQVDPENLTFVDMEIVWDMRHGPVAELDKKVIAPREDLFKKYEGAPAVWRDLGSALLTVGKRKKDAKDDAGYLADFQKARDIFAKGIVRFPDVPEFTSAYAAVCIELKEFDAAEKAVLELTQKEQFKDKPQTAQMMVEFYTRAGKLDKAESTLRELATRTGNKTEVLLNLAQLLVTTDKPDQALAVLDQGDGNISLVMKRLEILLAQKRMDDATKLVEAYGVKNPDDIELQKMRANLAVYAGNRDKAMQYLNTIMEKQPGDIGSRLLRGQILAIGPQAGLTQARTDLEYVIENGNRNKLEARILLADVLTRMTQYDKAIQVLEAAVREDPTSKGARLRLIDRYATYSPPKWMDADSLLQESRRAVPTFAEDADFYRMEASMQMVRENLPGAFATVQKALKAQPADMGLNHLQLSLLIMMKQYGQLITLSEKLSPDLQQQWWVKEARGVAKAQSGDKAAGYKEFAEAAKIAFEGKELAGASRLVETIQGNLGWDKAVEIIQPYAAQSDMWAMYSAQAMRSGNNFRAAIELLIRLRDNPKDATQTEQGMVRKMLAESYLRLDPPDTKAAIETYKDTTKYLTNDLAVLNNLAFLLLETPGTDPAEAIEAARRGWQVAQSVGNDDPLIQDTLGWALILGGRLDEGIAELRAALDKRSFVEGHYHIAYGYMKKDPPLRDEAERNLLQAQRMIMQLAQENRPVDKAMQEKIVELLKQVTAK